MAVGVIDGLGVLLGSTATDAAVAVGAAVAPPDPAPEGEHTGVAVAEP